MKKTTVTLASIKKAFDTRFDAIDTRFDKINIQFSKINARFNEIDDRFDAMTQRFGGIDDQLEAHSERLKNIQTEINQGFGKVIDKVQDFMGVCEENKTRIRRLENKENLTFPQSFV
jgi:archaellum component FlaC